MSLDGKSLLRSLREVLNESSTSDYMDDRTSYDYLYQAAMELVNRTECLRTTQSITTGASQSDYTLNADFMKLYLRDKDNKLYVKYNDGTSNSFLFYGSYDDIIYEDNTTAQTIPDRFTIIDDATDTQISSTATSTAAAVGGASILTDTTAPFADVSAGDVAHNTTDGSSGIVLSKTSTSVLSTALFDGTANDWTSSDAYVIQPQSRLKLMFNPPPSTASHTATVYYIQKPAPVYSDYGIYRFPQQYSRGLIMYALWLYKYRDKEPNFGDKYFQFFDMMTRQAANAMNSTFNRKGFVVNFKKR